MIFSKCIGYRLPVATLFLSCFALSGVAKRNNTGFRFLCQGFFYAIFASFRELLACCLFYTSSDTKIGKQTEESARHFCGYKVARSGDRPQLHPGHPQI